MEPYIEPNFEPKIEYNIENLDSFVPNIFGTNFFEQQQQPQLQSKWVLT